MRRIALFCWFDIALSGMAWYGMMMNGKKETFQIGISDIRRIS
jgi:hypothetical protein